MSMEDYEGELMKSDASLFPSYTRLGTPYRVICRQRYTKSGQFHRKQFIKEHKRIELLQPRALDGTRIHKEFCENIREPPRQENMISLSPKQQNTYQSGFISILYAGGGKPLGIWGQIVKNGHIRRVTDEDVQTLALEISGTNVATTYIICPAAKDQTLGIRLPFFIMIVKNMKKYFTFEITVLDDKNMSRRFRVSNYQSTTRVRPFSTSLPIGLTGGWNQIQFNLADFTRRAYGSSYLETLRVQIHANVRIRRIYFSDRLYAEDEMPNEFKLYVPITSQKERKPSKPKIPVADKQTGADKTRVSVITETKVEEAPSGALPTPAESPRIEAEQEIVAEATPVEAPAEEALEEGHEAGEHVEHGEHGEHGDEEMEGEEDLEESPTEATTEDVPPSETEAGSEQHTEEPVAEEALPAE